MTLERVLIYIAFVIACIIAFIGFVNADVVLSIIGIIGIIVSAIFLKWEDTL